MSLKRNRNQGNNVGSSGTPKIPNQTKRVEDIILSRNHPAYKSDDDIGTIFFTEIGFNQEVLNTVSLPRAKPASISNFTYPSIGEVVIVSEGPSANIYPDIDGDISNKILYYTPPINIHSNTTNNALPTPNRSKKKKNKRSSDIGNESEEYKLGNYFKENSKLKPLLPGEGDSIMEGKNGQRIRFTTTGPNGTNSISNGVTDDPNDGNPSIGDKAMVLSLGNGNQENITNDAASIYMLENQSLPIDATSTNVDSLKSTYTPIITPLEEISKPPIQKIPQALPDNELIFEPINFNLEAPIIEKSTSPPPRIPTNPDPVFNALDEASEEGLIEFQEENIEIAGGEVVNFVEQQPEVTTPEAFDGEVPTGDFRKINIEAERQWKLGKPSIFKNKSGRALSLLQPDTNLIITPTTLRTIKYIMIHTAASADTSTPASLMRFFFNERDNIGWNTGGYHWIIDRGGKATRCYPDSVLTNGTKDNGNSPNSECIHINWIGGYSRRGEPLNRNMTQAQAFTFKRLLKKYIVSYSTFLNIDLKIMGHNQHRNKSCPLFNVPTFCKEIGISSDNIFNSTWDVSNFNPNWDAQDYKDEAIRLAKLT